MQNNILLDWLVEKTFIQFILERKSGVSIFLIASQTIPNIANSIGDCINASAIQGLWVWMMLCVPQLQWESLSSSLQQHQYNEAGPGYSQ